MNKNTKQREYTNAYSNPCAVTEKKHNANLISLYKLWKRMVQCGWKDQEKHC